MTGSSQVQRFTLLGAATALTGALSAADLRPNIVLIVADDLGSGDLSCYGATKLKTPNIDALASQGVRMTDACASAAVCQPSRYSILTGEYAHRIQKQGVYQTYFRPGQQSIASVLKTAGYRTAAVGKWHNGFSRGAEPDYNRRNLVANKSGAAGATPLDIGFDAFSVCRAATMTPPTSFLRPPRTAPAGSCKSSKGTRLIPWSSPRAKTARSGRSTITATASAPARTPPMPPVPTPRST
jgi:arylsulfatase A-like enzyme